MNEQDLKNIWKQTGQEELVVMDQLNLVSEMEQQHQSIEKAIKARDKREILVSWIMMPIFLIMGIMIPYTLSKVGAFLMLPVLGFIIYKLKSLRKYKPAEINSDAQAYLEQLKLYYTLQKDMLKEVLYWYLIPLGLCVSLIYVGMPFSTISKVGYMVFLVLLYGGIYFMNQAAVKNKYQPLLKNIEENLQGLNKA